MIESNDEIQEYDRIIKETIKDGFFNEIEEEFEYNIFNDSNILNETTNLYENTSQNLISFNVYFNFRINEKIDNVFKIESDDLNIDTQKVSDLISDVIKKINAIKINIKYDSNEFILSLKEYENYEFYDNNYELKPCDKISHYCKYDCPFFPLTLKLYELIGQEICFIVKKTNNIKLLQKSKNE